MVILPSLSNLAALATLASAALAATDPVRRHAAMLERRGVNVLPSAPGPGAVFRSGQQCTMTWAPATSPRWKSMTIDLMTGANQAMTKLTNVATNVDGTTQSTYSFTCPEVDPNAPIYFYQFTDKSGGNPAWTTRFTIASDSGNTVAAPNAKQPEGDAIPWGTGSLVSGGASSSNSTSSSSTSASSSAAPSSSSSTSDSNNSNNLASNATSSSSSKTSGAADIFASSHGLTFLSAAAVAAGALLA